MAGRRKRGIVYEETRTVRLAGEFTPGQPIDRSVNDEIEIWRDVADEHEEVYRVNGYVGPLNLRPDDLLVVEPRPDGNAATMQYVLADHAGRAYVGLWWTKRGKRALMADATTVVVEGPKVRVLGAITLTARRGGPQPNRRTKKEPNRRTKRG